MNRGQQQMGEGEAIAIIIKALFVLFVVILMLTS